MSDPKFDPCLRCGWYSYVWRQCKLICRRCGLHRLCCEDCA